METAIQNRSGGSVANDTAVRIAHFYFSALGKSSKRLIISRRYAYHGSTYLAAALSGKASDKTGFQFPEDLVHHVSEANCYRMPDGVDDESSYCDFLVREFERKIAELGAENVACFFAEPIMGAGGVLVAIANIDVMEREDICGRVRSTGPWFEERLKTLGDLPIVGDVRGSHLMLCVESVRDRESKEPFGDDIEIGKRIARRAQSRGLIVRPIGNLNVLSPALTLSREEIDRIVAMGIIYISNRNLEICRDFGYSPTHRFAPEGTERWRRRPPAKLTAKASLSPDCSGSSPMTPPPNAGSSNSVGATNLGARTAAR